ncbi:MAG TPA: phosphoadenosine phosphosulfate reductase, partial [Methylobacterium sp.]|nr:phosphoadenosine phosphosulfate reductase [Methylobacterium sp.]
MTLELAKAAEALAAAMAGLDLKQRIALVEAEIPGRLVFTTSLGIEDQALTHALALAKSRTEIVTLDTGRLFP